jgi:hypothetical protein
MEDLNTRELAVGLERKLQVAIDEKLVEAFSVTRVGHVIHLDFD